ncbi:membrane-bound alkaline phosphatase-like [Daktulosphaira vitifoliae]|uniref:membrane-bound alkaline phosphatase-like n=1 Tax=Daktulosphaira vitifoliae TaxID=58002 RepID=UPI0021A9DFB5|nr:membrane-bound alkaline phosphatase-like [Daktulosphaira vitifoliae]
MFSIARVMKTYILVLLVCILRIFEINGSLTETETNPESVKNYWLESGQNYLEKVSKLALRTNTAKNLIIFMGDGMSLTTITAARIYNGQINNRTGESDYLSFENFPFTGKTKTYCVNKQVPDSACTATAYLCGVKNNIGTIGVTSKVKKNDCQASIVDDKPESIMQWSQWARKATGIVTTTRITHASPAGAFAHVSNRDWESDEDILKFKDKTNISQCEDIAKQLITREPGKNFRVIMGGGRSKFLMKRTNTTYERSDEDLVLRWKNDKKTRVKEENAVYVTNREDLLKIDISNVDYLLGLFHDSHFDYRLQSDIIKQPTLQEMTKKAIEILQKENNGYVLFVEGGLIDISHHATYAKIALDETVELSKAVSEAVAMTKEDDTLIVVTSDHAHTMTMAGYPQRGANILGLASSTANDDMPYTTLSYANGPKDENMSNCHRMNVTDEYFEKDNMRYPSLVPLEAETHGGEDVMVFARGPWAHLFTGNYEQNIIPLAMAKAAQLPLEKPTSA